MKKIEINSKVENGQLVANRKAITDAIKSFEGQNIIISIEKRKKKRSNNQNAFYFGIVITIIQDAFKDAWGEYYSATEVHEALKAKYCFKEQVNENTGEILQIPSSTTNLSTIEWEEYIEKIRAFAFEWFNVTIPMPNEQITIDF
jgi:imidazole glycerol phosphate synthase subunit HisF